MTSVVLGTQDPMYKTEMLPSPSLQTGKQNKHNE